MSIIFPAGVGNRVAEKPLKKTAQPMVSEPPVEEPAPDATACGGICADEGAVAPADDLNPAFEAIKGLPGFKEEADAIVGEESALDSLPVAEPSGDPVADAAAKISDAAAQIAEAAEDLAGEAVVEPAGEEAAAAPAGEAVVEIEPAKEDAAPCDTPPCDDDKAEGDKPPFGEKPEDKPEEKSEEKEEIKKEGTEKEASASDGMQRIAKLSPENKTFLRAYWGDALGFPKEYVDAMVTDYEK